MNHRLLPPAALAALLSLGSLAAAQDPIRDYLGQEEHTIQPLALPAGLPADFRLAIEIDGRAETLLLEKRAARTADFQVLVDEGGGRLRAVAPPPVATYRGTILGRGDARVALSLLGASAQGAIFLDDGTMWFLEPLAAADPLADPALHLVYPLVASPFARGACGAEGFLSVAEEVAPAGRGGSEPARSAICAAVTDLAFDCDYESYLEHGSSVSATVLDIEGVVNEVNVPYERDVDITHLLGTVIVRTAEPDPYTSTDPGTVLGEFGNEWNTNQTGVVRDIAHFATGKELDGNIIGLAWVGVVCTGLGYGITQFHGLGHGSHVMVVAHEIGHNWNAPHCADALCDIMCGGCSLSFGPNNCAIIRAHRRTRGCIDIPPPHIDYTFPPNIEALYPGTAQAVLIGGDCFEATSTVSVNGVPLTGDPPPFTVFNRYAITFDMPQVDSLGSVEIGVSDWHGTGTTTAQVVFPPWPRLQAGTGDNEDLVDPQDGVDLILAGEPGHLHYGIYSFSGIPSSHPLIDLDLGNNFTDIGTFGIFPIDAKGWIPLHAPLDPLRFTFVYVQTFDLTTGFPARVSNLQQFYVYF
ncbi:MAG: M12 family metallo-peptidase [Planctomycetota bacterium]